MLPGPAESFGLKAATLGAYQFLLLADEARSFREDFAFVNFSRWVVFGLYGTFLLPLVTLAFASNSLGGEREGRTLIWLVTRPLPRQAVYVAKFLGVLPWCVLAAVFGFACLCLAGGDLGRRAFAVYWPSVLAATLAFAALFHFIGALFRWPAVVGLVYIFFFELLVNNLPGSLKRLSLNYYLRSLLYNDAASVAPGVRPGSVDVYDPLGSTACWIVLLSAAVLITALGAHLFSRQEPKEEA
jgi:ABC-type transport system involved in multi-copper enzyme maturation permease subunit